MTFGVALLDELRPPVGYETAFALGTTYSLDLVTCTAALLALDGRSADEVDIPSPAVLRALKRLEGKIHVVAQRGCIGVPRGSHAGITSLLDRIVVGVALPRSRMHVENDIRCTFHPKVWLVRYTPQDPAVDATVWKIAVSSRNLTSHDAWDLGVTLTGAVSKHATNVSNIRPFAERVLKLKGADPSAKELGRVLKELDSVEWDLPEGVKRARFCWNGGGSKPRTTSEGHPSGLPSRAEWVLVVSPFLSQDVVELVAKRWSALDKEDFLFVAGIDDLEKIARKRPRIFDAMSPCFLDAVVPEVDGTVAEETTTAEIEEAARGLHAKIVAVWHDRKRATVMLGSPNLTVEGWHGANCEAWMLLEGKAPAIADPLWVWAEARTRAFDPDNLREEQTDAEGDALDAVRDAIARERFALDDDAGSLRCTSARRLPLGVGIALAVRRATQLPSMSARWTERSGAQLLSPTSSERTRFIVMTLRTKTGRTKSWIQDVDVSPPIDAARDEAAFSALLPTSAQLWEYIEGVLDDSAFDADTTMTPRDDNDEPNRLVKTGRSKPRELELWLERLLASLARARAENRLSEVLAMVDAAVASHRKQAPSVEDPRIASFVSVWDAIKAGFA